ncbi:MAG: hypothetical protein WC322_03840 [Candidatus Paceibacterota bacterium]|jgi:hypothetical protein
MDKFKEPFGARPDDLPTPRGANITVGLDAPCGCGANASDLERGFVKVKDADSMPSPFGLMDGGVVGRARGWER